MSRIRVVINGVRGRMGQALLACAADHPNLEVVAGVDVGDDLVAALAGADGVIDFTQAHCTEAVVKTACAAGKWLVLGTTGQSEEVRGKIAGAAREIPIVFAPNFSVGVNTLFWLTRKATGILGEDFDLEVVEMHHRHKQDSPSGTARRLAEILCEVRDLQYTGDVLHGREGMVGARTRREVGMHAIRGGDVVGDHTVIFANSGERLELTHKASSRDTFAHGALRAAGWIHGREAGLYDMLNVLGLPE
jgi:4-hydroxy-tetrahydrodipicolinate reductase